MKYLSTLELLDVALERYQDGPIKHILNSARRDILREHLYDNVEGDKALKTFAQTVRKFIVEKTSPTKARITISAAGRRICFTYGLLNYFTDKAGADLGAAARKLDNFYNSYKNCPPAKEEEKYRDEHDQVFDSVKTAVKDLIKELQTTFNSSRFAVRDFSTQWPRTMEVINYSSQGQVDIVIEIEEK